MDEWEFNFMFDECLEPFDNIIIRPVFKWKDQNGRIWKLEDLSNEHLVNIIRFLERKEPATDSRTIKRREFVFQVLRAEQERRISVIINEED